MLNPSLQRPANLPSLEARAGLSERIAEKIAQRIASGALPPGARLEAEGEMARQFSVSRTVVREALSRLKSEGLLISRQGSGVFVQERVIRPLRIDLRSLSSIDDVLQIVEVRLAIEAEAAALAAVQRTAGQLRAIEDALAAIGAAEARREPGVEEDVAFHRSIAEATGNRFYVLMFDFIGQYLYGATQVTRTDWTDRSDVLSQVREEHEAIVAAIRAREVLAARQAAARHMLNAARRIRDADPDFVHGRAWANPPGSSRR